MTTSVHPTPILRIGTHPSEEVDLLAVEEPLEIRLGHGPWEDRQQHRLSVTMRTPGHDFELALGFLFAEDIIQTYDQVHSLRYCTQVQHPEERDNVVRVELAPSVVLDLARLQRHFYTSSSCGVCGKASIEALAVACPRPLPTDFSVAEEAIHRAPALLRRAQLVFEHTGGLHAAGLFDSAGTLLRWREDVGRHNALDKLIGSYVAENQQPLRTSFVLLSGRVSFELVQKAIRAGIPLVAAVGAPSSLAVALARQYGLTLLGFVRDQRFNVYTGEARVVLRETVA
ncbi:FdhD protein [Catalinimonas alkaloidigena]|uniref:Sulfur carrier protein FdhD n=1 Tax=Catalinimonas alkaloidigena TaxID=1075417 RepID=A0A1G9T230_9BACT|nr:formate dehydrogenase accessory sulfurtransferase FdhD [Catalinimonas alkaloidigena]SDM41678.1 FdhD protein [Catalinimonas alkaloidigena]